MMQPQCDRFCRAKHHRWATQTKRLRAAHHEADV